MNQSKFLELNHVAGHARLRDPERDGQFADAEWPALVEASERRQKPSRNIAAFRPRQLVDIALQAFTDAFQAAAEGEVPPLADEVVLWLIVHMVLYNTVWILP